jgi:uncharacterized membrane protein
MTAAVAHIEEMTYRRRRLLDRIAGAIIRVAGSTVALLFHVAFFTFWLAANVGLFPAIDPFDPFPFGLLTTIVSLEAIFLTLFVLIAQNRMSREADRRAQLDLEVNLLSEQESTMTLRMLEEISRHLGIEGRTRKDVSELLKETNLADLAQKLDGALPRE